MLAAVFVGVQSVYVQLDKSLVTISTVLPAVRIQELIEETGRKAVLFGVKATDGWCQFNDDDIVLFVCKNLTNVL